jgi:hypothetical protein
MGSGSDTRYFALAFPNYDGNGMRELFPNCPHYIHKYQLVERSAHVPRAGVETPVPAWKRFEWAHDVLPAGDPARDDES